MNKFVNAVLEKTDSIITQLNETFEILENSNPNKPRLVNVSDYWVWRFVEKEIHQALILKTARSISLVSSIRLLYEHGFHLEMAGLQRLLDETNEDTFFWQLDVSMKSQNYMIDIWSRFGLKKLTTPASLESQVANNV